MRVFPPRFYVNCKIFILLPDSAPEAAACLSCLREIPSLYPLNFIVSPCSRVVKVVPRGRLYGLILSRREREEEEVGGDGEGRVRMSMVRLRFILQEGLLAT